MAHHDARSPVEDYLTNPAAFIKDGLMKTMASPATDAQERLIDAIAQGKRLRVIPPSTLFPDRAFIMEEARDRGLFFEAGRHPSRGFAIWSDEE